MRVPKLHVPLLGEGWGSLIDPAGSITAPILWRLEDFPEDEDGWVKEDLLSPKAREEGRGSGVLLSLRDREGLDDEDREGRDEDERDLSL